MLTLERKIDELNAKIDALSQHILKLEQQVSRPGMLIGETSPSPVPNAATTTTESAHPSAANGTTHVVARGETLTSIAKQYKVGVEELQKFNHIEDGRKLQAGQTVMTGTDNRLIGQRQNFFHIIFDRLFIRNISTAH